MEQLHAEVAKLQAIGMRFLDIKQEVGLLLQQLLELCTSPLQNTNDGPHSCKLAIAS